MNDNKRKNIGDDEFWSIDYMMPPKRNLASFSKDTDTAEIDIPPVGNSVRRDAAVSISERRANIADRNIPVRPASELLKPRSLASFTYSPENRLISSITVTEWDSKYTFYRKFRLDAEKYFDKRGSECVFVPIYLTIPQYSLMKPEQLHYYFWWRSNVRNGVYLESAYGYILTYIYEIINLPELIKPENGLDMLTDIWLAYRDKFWKLDTYLCEWVCDYCCIHRLSPPLDKLRPILGVIYTFASFKEFYSEYSSDGNESYWCALLNIGSDCNWRKSKFYTPETADIFDKHMKGAFIYAAERLAVTDSRFVNSHENGLTSTIVRPSYSEALCVYDIKRRITVEYTAVSRSPELRRMVEVIIKISENNIRAILGKKSRYQIPPEYSYLKKLVDEYFVPVRASLRQSSKTPPPEPEYMKLYDAPSTGITPENAKSIEESSWSVTEILVDAFEDNTPGTNSGDNGPLCDDTPEIIQSVENREAGHDDSLIYDRALLCLLKGDRSGFAEIANDSNMMQDSLCEGINEVMYDIIGDICIEDYKVIDDYITDVTEYLKEKGVLNG